MQLVLMTSQSNEILLKILDHFCVQSKQLDVSTNFIERRKHIFTSRSIKDVSKGMLNISNCVSFNFVSNSSLVHFTISQDLH